MRITRIENDSPFAMNVTLAAIEYDRVTNHNRQLVDCLDFLCREINELLEYGEFSDDLDHVPKNAHNRRREALEVLKAMGAHL